MPLYLTTIEGSGQGDDPRDFRRPPRVGPIRNVLPGWIDFGTHGVIEMPAFSDPRFRLIANDASLRISAGAQAMLNGELGVALSGQPDCGELLRDLLEDQADGVRWKPLRSQRDGTLAIYLGGRPVGPVRRVAPRHSSKSFTETWAGADGTALTVAAGRDHDWTEVTGDMEVVSNVLQNAAGINASEARCDSALDTDDHYHALDFSISVRDATNRQVRSCVRYADANNFYTLSLLRNTGGDHRQLFKRVAGANTVLSGDTTDPGASGTIYCQADGSSISGAIVGVVTHGPVTDTALTGTLTIGARIFNASATKNEVTVDSHVFYDLYGASPAPLLVPYWGRLASPAGLVLMGG